MSSQTMIVNIVPTPLLRHAGETLHQIARVTVHHQGASVAGTMHIRAGGTAISTPVSLVAGESVLEVEVPELSVPGEVSFTLDIAGTPVARQSLAWQPPKRWVVHVVQLSHHDVGYTDLASHVLPEHDHWLDTAIELAEATREFPEEARFRVVVEQTWLIEHFLRHTTPARREAMLTLLRRGDVEVTALFGNLVTELCGHETLVRSVYHAFRLKREYGIPLVSAEHNDIPGFSWGLSQVLSEAGIKILCPGLPNYYGWGHPGATSFWDEAAIFGAAGQPGAFWWEAPTGKGVLFWCNNQGCGGDSHPSLPGLFARLQSEANYPSRCCAGR